VGNTKQKNGIKPLPLLRFQIALKLNSEASTKLRPHPQSHPLISTHAHKAGKKKYAWINRGIQAISQNSLSCTKARIWLSIGFQNKNPAQFLKG